jgi:hypothetical protein
MKRHFITVSAILLSISSLAQIPEDAIRMSWNIPSGTARHQAIGGAMGSLGGEITSVFVNPAGLGFYKTGEVVISPSLSFLGGKSNFRGTDAEADNISRFNFGTSGVVWSQTNPRARWGTKAFSLAINRTANFNGRTLYRGENDFSSYSESFAEEFASSGLPINVSLPDAPLSFGTKLANYTYLIDTATVFNRVEVVGLPTRYSLVTGGDFLLLQEKDIQTKGGITEVAFGFASNMQDKVYVGGSIGLPIVNFERTATFTETDITGDNNNDFDYFTYRERYRAQGVGVNGKLGVIFRPGGSFRGGVAIHTPTVYSLTERTTGRMEADLENYFSDGQIGIADEDTIYSINNVAVPEYTYDYYSPWRFLVSGSYVINAVEDVTRQRGFITADVEYVTHRSSRFKSVEDEDYYEGVNEAIKFSYKGAMNMRIGGEMKFNTLMTRLGFAYYGSPYDEKEFKARRMNISGGVGYRNRGLFLDLTYVHGLNRDVDFPYRLSDKANTFAEIRNRSSNVLLTFGWKF